jgi:hypothetical protein
VEVYFIGTSQFNSLAATVDSGIIDLASLIAAGFGCFGPSIGRSLYFGHQHSEKISVLSNRHQSFQA